MLDDSAESDGVETFAELAQRLELDEETLAKHLKVTGRDGEQVTLHDVLSAYRKPAPEAVEFEKQRERLTDLESKEHGWVSAAEELRQTAQAFANQMRASEPNWEQVKQQSPERYLELRLQWVERQQQIERAAEQYEAHQRKIAEQEALKVQSFRVEQARKLKASRPEWSDQNTFERDLDRTAQFLMKNGVSQDEINQLSDHRDWSIAHKAMLYEELQAKKPETLKRVKQLPKLVAPGVARGPDRGSAKVHEQEGEQILARLKETGSSADARAAIEHRLKSSALRAAGRRLSAGRRT
jgi:hypothetical protein